MAECKHHIDHENRIERLEGEMIKTNERIDGCNEKIKDPRPLVAVLGLIGMIFTTAGSIIGTVLGAYLKSKGLL